MLSYETFAHVKDMVDARLMEQISIKGISRAIIPTRSTAPIPASRRQRR